MKLKRMISCVRGIRLLTLAIIQLIVQIIHHRNGR